MRCESSYITIYLDECLGTWKNSQLFVHICCSCLHNPRNMGKFWTRASSLCKFWNYEVRKEPGDTTWKTWNGRPWDLYIFFSLIKKSLRPVCPVMSLEDHFSILSGRLMPFKFIKKSELFQLRALSSAESGKMNDVLSFCIRAIP